MVPLPVAVIVRDVVNSPGLVGIKTGIVDHSEEPAALSGPEDLDAAAKWNVELVVTLPRYLVAGHRGGHNSGMRRSSCACASRATLMAADAACPLVTFGAVTGVKSRNIYFPDMQDEEASHAHMRARNVSVD